jgi:CDP-2,3-bis-(O-geranylgeranyl)-sn-glycerol synthase
VDDAWLALRLLALLALANTAPIVLKRVLGARGAAPLDAGRLWRDGRPLLGPAKTWRGLAGATLATALAAPLLGIPAGPGALLGLLAMTGDALSSFAKRRLGVPSSGRAFGLDQVPEALLPLLVLRESQGWPWTVVAGVTLAFLLLEVPAAWLAHRIGLRDRPY